MRIGIDATPLLDKQYSGVSELTYQLLKNIIPQDQDNTYVLFCNSRHKLPVNFNELTRLGAKVETTHYPSKVFNYILQKRLGYPKLDKRTNADIFYSPHFNFGAILKATPAIMTVHDVSFLHYPEFFSWRKNVWHRQLDIIPLLQKQNRLVAVSEQTKQDVIRMCQIDAEKISVVYPGINSLYLNNATSQNDKDAIVEKYHLPKKFIYTLGTIEPRKNIDGLILAYEALREKYQDLSEYHLVIAGASGWKNSAIYQTWEKSKFKNQIHFLGYVPLEDKLGLYQLATIFVYLSYYEGFGFPPLEAMASGTPVVSSYAGSLAEVLADAALLVDPYNHLDATEAMATMLQSESVRQIYIERGLNQAKQFNWKNTALKYLEIFKTAKKIK
ncbi:MAG: glycosyltransferase family 1 protein [Candidatus Falkowbacteria bacterium]